MKKTALIPAIEGKLRHEWGVCVPYAMSSLTGKRSSTCRRYCEQVGERKGSLGVKIHHIGPALSLAGFDHFYCNPKVHLGWLLRAINKHKALLVTIDKYGSGHAIATHNGFVCDTYHKTPSPYKEWIKKANDGKSPKIIHAFISKEIF